jgi:hypothetical protein
MKIKTTPHQTGGYFLIYACISITVLLLALAAVQVQSSSKPAPQAEAMINQISAIAEQAYFDGQREALQGDIRIAWNTNSQTWSWIKSPWNEGMKPNYDPSHAPAPKPLPQPEKP